MPISSQVLLSHHVGVYESFFDKYDRVLSTSHMLRWGNSVSRSMTQVSIKQKLPANIYVGVRYVPTPGIHFDHMHSYIPSRDHFIVQPMHNCFSHEALSGLTKEFSQILKQLGLSKDVGLHIGFLTEYPRGAGFGVLGGISTMLAAVALLLAGKLTKELLNEHTTFIASPIFEELGRYMSQLDMAADGSPSGVHHHICCGTSDLPYLITTPPRKNLSTMGDTASCMVSNIGSIAGAENGRSYTFEDMPCDWCIIHFGVHYHASHTKKSYAFLQDSTQEASEFITGLMQDMGWSDADMNYTQQDIEHMSALLTSNISKSLVAGLQNQEKQEDLIKGVAESGIFSASMEKSNMNLSDLYYAWHRFAGKDAPVGFCPIGSARSGGSYLACFPKGAYRNSPQDMITFFKEHGYTDTCILYTSRDDGGSTRGLMWVK